MLTARAHSLVHQKLWVTISTRRGCLSITQLFCRYVLLKERNMLLTLRHESKRQGVPMPSPTRLHKVRGGQPASRRYPCFWTPNGFNELQEMSFNPSQEVQEAALISLFSTPNRFNKLQEMRNLTPVSDVYKAVPTSFFWAPNRHNELLELRFEFPFNLIGKLTMAFLLGQLWRDTNPGTLVGVQNKDFGTVLTPANRFKHRFSSICGAGQRRNDAFKIQRTDFSFQYKAVYLVL